MFCTNRAARARPFMAMLLVGLAVVLPGAVHAAAALVSARMGAEQDVITVLNSSSVPAAEKRALEACRNSVKKHRHDEPCRVLASADGPRHWRAFMPPRVNTLVIVSAESESDADQELTSACRLHFGHGGCPAGHRIWRGFDRGDKQQGTPFAPSGAEKGRQALRDAYGIGSAASGADLQALIGAAKGGDREAQYELAMHYREGKGLPKMPQHAVVWMKRSASAGYAKAQYSFGKWLLDGQPALDRDVPQGVRFIRQAAEQGYSPAQNLLGTLYVRGTGVKRDLSEGYRWVALAAEAGYAPAVKNKAAIEKALKGTR